VQRGGILLNGYLAHRTGRRRLHTALPMILAGISLAGAILAGSHLAVYGLRSSAWWDLRSNPICRFSGVFRRVFSENRPPPLLWA